MATGRRRGCFALKAVGSGERAESRGQREGGVSLKDRGADGWPGAPRSPSPSANMPVKFSTQTNPPPSPPPPPKQPPGKSGVGGTSFHRGCRQRGVTPRSRSAAARVGRSLGPASARRHTSGPGRWRQPGCGQRGHGHRGAATRATRARRPAVARGG